MFLALWLLIASVAAFAFYRHGHVLQDPALSRDSAVSPVPVHGSFDLIYYSLAVQTAFGDPSYSPGDTFTRFVSLAQGGVGLSLIAIWFGLIGAKIISRRHNLQFARSVVYDPDRHQFLLWAWNRDAYDLFDIKVTLGVEKPIDRYRLKIAHEPTFIEPMLGIDIATVRTTTATAASRDEPNAADLLTKDEDGLHLFELRDEDTLTVEIRAVAGGSLQNLFFKQRYHKESIFCGQWAGEIDRIGDWHFTPFERFDNVVETKPERCPSCDHFAECWLQPAKQQRAVLLAAQQASAGAPASTATP